MPIRIAHKKSECIGCALCTEIAPDYWTMDANGEAQLRTVIRTDATFEYAEGYTPDRDRLEAAETGCPVGIIQLQ